MSMAANVSGAKSAPRPMTKEEKRVILASSLGTVFEWYDFYLYGSLAAIIGAKPVPRTEVTKKVWEYIKANKLQDAAKKTMINADAKLKEIFKKAQVSMFEMTKLISDQLS